MGAVEKIGFPTGMAIMILLANWYGLLLTMAFDTLFCIATLAYAMKGQRIEYIFKAWPSRRYDTPPSASISLASVASGSISG